MKLEENINKMSTFLMRKWYSVLPVITDEMSFSNNIFIRLT